MKKVLALLFFVTAVLLPACTQHINGCVIRPETQCSGADLREADLHRTDLSEADLQGANLSGANLSEADLREARYDSDTKFPEGFDPEAAGMVLVEDDD
jgi:hypothetical protein